MCGIAGVVADHDSAALLVDAIKNLEYRGYDSCGVAMLNGSGLIEVRKNVGAVDEVRDHERLHELAGHIGIAHTRWATHGGVTRDNAHPHVSCDGNFAITHNGIISNYGVLRQRLMAEGHAFRSQTDTEVIVHLIEGHYRRLGSVEGAFVAALKELEGTYAVSLITPLEPDRIYCARKESPLILGLGSRANYIGSDYNAFIAWTKQAVILDDHEYAVVGKDDYVIRSLHDGEAVVRKVQHIQWDPEMAQKGGFPHYMLKEIYEQPQVVRAALDIDRESIAELARQIAGRKRCYLTGVGTTFYVVQFAQYYFGQYAGVTPSLASSDEFPFLANVDADTVVIAASQSGETYDTLTALRHSRERGAYTAAVVNVMGSSMARLVDHLILQGSGPEISVISTKAALSQMIVLARVALELGLVNGHLTKKEYQARHRELACLPDLIEELVNEQGGAIHTVAREQAHIRHWLFLGRGRYYPVARESALKMKEVAYVHAEGMPSGFLKHGTIALIDDALNSVVFLPAEADGDLYRLTLSAAEEIRAREGYVLAFTVGKPKGKGLPFSETIELPRCPSFVAPLVEMVAAQLLSYYVATTLKRNIDRPRALAKSVTVA